MPTVVIPRLATTVPCPNCGRVLRNLAMLGIKRQVPCLCGATVTVERRRLDAPAQAVIEKERRRA